MVNDPTFLGLPLETRQHIYSHCLLNTRDLDMVTEDMHHLIRSLLFTNRQISDEASTFYYAKNTFQLSLINAHYNARERGRRTYLEHHLARVKNLCLVIKTSPEQRASTAIGDVHVFFPSISQFPKQQQQWYWFIDALSAVKSEQAEPWLACLRIRDTGLESSVVERRPLIVLGEGGNEVVAPYSFILETVLERIGRVEVQQLTEAQQAEGREIELPLVDDGLVSQGRFGN